jgi:hypothetical protein
MLAGSRARFQKAVFALEAAFLFRPLVLFRKKITPALIFAALVPETT